MPKSCDSDNLRPVRLKSSPGVSGDSELASCAVISACLPAELVQSSIGGDTLPGKRMAGLALKNFLALQWRVDDLSCRIIHQCRSRRLENVEFDLLDRSTGLDRGSGASSWWRGRPGLQFRRQSGTGGQPS